MEEKVIQTLSRQRDSGTIVELVENEAGFRFVVKRVQNLEAPIYRAIFQKETQALTRLKACVEAAGCELYEISAGTTQGTRNLMRVVAERLRTLPPVTIYEPEYVETAPEAGDPSELSIEHLGSTWVITGQWLERLVMNINFDDYESRNYFDQQLRKSGLFARLEEMGIQDGDTVDIYDLQFDYQR